MVRFPDSSMANLIILLPIKINKRKRNNWDVYLVNSILTTKAMFNSSCTVHHEAHKGAPDTKRFGICQLLNYIQQNFIPSDVKM